jgi:hypothetical protein
MRRSRIQNTYGMGQFPLNIQNPSCILFKFEPNKCKFWTDGHEATRTSDKNEAEFKSEREINDWIESIRICTDIIIFFRNIYWGNYTTTAANKVLDFSSLERPQSSIKTGDNRTFLWD